jgi:hypothetical protein
MKAGKVCTYEVTPRASQRAEQRAADVAAGKDRLARGNDEQKDRRAESAKELRDFDVLTSGGILEDAKVEARLAQLRASSLDEASAEEARAAAEAGLARLTALVEARKKHSIIVAAQLKHRRAESAKELRDFDVLTPGGILEDAKVEERLAQLRAASLDRASAEEARAAAVANLERLTALVEARKKDSIIVAARRAQIASTLKRFDLLDAGGRLASGAADTLLAELRASGAEMQVLEDAVRAHRSARDSSKAAMRKVIVQACVPLCFYWLIAHNADPAAVQLLKDPFHIARLVLNDKLTIALARAALRSGSLADGTRLYLKAGLARRSEALNALHFASKAETRYLRAIADAAGAPRVRRKQLCFAADSQEALSSAALEVRRALGHPALPDGAARGVTHHHPPPAARAVGADRRAVERHRPAGGRRAFLPAACGPGGAVHVAGRRRLFDQVGQLPRSVRARQADAPHRGLRRRQGHHLVVHVRHGVYHAHLEGDAAARGRARGCARRPARVLHRPRARPAAEAAHARDARDAAARRRLHGARRCRRAPRRALVLRCVLRAA